MTEEKMLNQYRVNPFCPNCGEEHIGYDIIISDEDQMQMDDYYAAHQGESSLALLLAPPPVVVERSFRCPACDTVFSRRIGIYRENRIGYRSNECVPACTVPL